MCRVGGVSWGGYFWCMSYLLHCYGLLQQFLYHFSESMVFLFQYKSNLFLVGVGICQGYTLSQILFITFMNFYRISRSSQIMDAFLFGGLGITYLLFAEDLVLWFITFMDRIFRHSQVVEDIQCVASGSTLCFLERM